MGLLDWFLHSTPKIEEESVSATLVEETIDYLVKMTDARLALVDGYRQRLSAPVTCALRYLGAQRASLPPSHPVGPHSWSQDPSIRAFFGQPADLLDVFSQCEALHKYAQRTSPLEPIHAILAMEFEEQQRFGVGLQGSLVVRDVAQTALNFSHHRLRLFAHSDQELWQSMARRMLDELALIALGRMQAEQAERRELEEHRRLLSARLATFQLRGIGGDSFLGDAGAMVSNEESAELLHKLEANETQLAALGCPSETLDRQLDYLAEVLCEPTRAVRFEFRREHLDSMNVVQEGSRGDEVQFGVVCFDRQPPVRRAFLPVEVDRKLVGEGRQLKLENAERWL